VNPWKIQPSSESSRARALAHQDQLTKPRGSLGRLEEVAVQLAAWQQSDFPSSRPAAALLFAADHPIACRGVSAYPQAVTAAMVQNFVRGGAAANVAARTLNIPLAVFDVGVASPLALPSAAAGVRFRRFPVADLEEGDIRVEEAMSEEVYRLSWEAGAAAVDELDRSTRLVILGEMGIGNTTLAAAVAAALLSRPAEDLVGPGTGLEGEALGKKVVAVRQALTRANLGPHPDPHRVMRAVGGREMAAMASAAGRALERGMAVLVDGFIVSAAMLAVVRLEKTARQGLFFGHCSAEPGHRAILQAMEARPLIELGMRLGEGTGAMAALPLMDLACALHRDMATFQSAGVPGPESKR
jgi:nicotinate-nucleotide--dimethylbenzimidazole phosphoribosyltransferase